MGSTLKATFETRREAEMTVERLVQEYGIERTEVFISATGDENTVGGEQVGCDIEAGAPSPEVRDDAPLNGTVTVSVDVEDDTRVAKVREAFSEFEAADMDEG